MHINKKQRTKRNLIIIHIQSFKMCVCACLTVQSTPVRSSLLGPLDAGGREGWGGPRCWRPEREIAFLKNNMKQTINFYGQSKPEMPVKRGSVKQKSTQSSSCMAQLSHQRAAKSLRELDFGMI